MESGSHASERLPPWYRVGCVNNARENPWYCVNTSFALLTHHIPHHSVSSISSVIQRVPTPHRHPNPTLVSRTQRLCPVVSWSPDHDTCSRTSGLVGRPNHNEETSAIQTHYQANTSVPTLAGSGNSSPHRAQASRSCGAALLQEGHSSITGHFRCVRYPT